MHPAPSVNLASVRQAGDLYMINLAVHAAIYSGSYPAIYIWIYPEIYTAIYPVIYTE